MRRHVVALALSACAAPSSVTPAVDRPPDGTDADPFGEIDTIELELAEPGATGDLASASFAVGQSVGLDAASVSGPVVVHLVGRAGDADIAYGRTCAFDPADVVEPHLYFARTVRWGPMSGIRSAVRNGGIAVSDQSGGAILAGGVDGAGTPVTAVERFDPIAGAFVALGETAPRVGAKAAILGDGRVVLVGGGAFFEVIDPAGGASDAIVKVDDSDLDRTGGAVATLSDGKAIEVGGVDTTGTVVGSIAVIADEDGQVVARPSGALLSVPRSAHTASRLSDDVGAAVVVIGGLDAAGAPVATAELYKPLRDEVLPAASFGPQMLVPRSHHAVVRTPDGGLLVVGGVDAAGQPVRQLELFSIDAGFSDAGELPPDAGAIDPTVTALPDGRILIAGGRATVGGAPVASTFIARLDPVDGSVDVVPTDSMDRPRANAQAAILCDGTILVAGGEGAGAPAAERYNPPATGRR